ncbi:spermatogenesis-associated protein 4 [Fundulus diaphanus]
MSNPPLHREVIKWLQGLELSFYPKNLRRDFSNGYLIAEIFSHYYPQDFSMHSYHKEVSFSTKQQNWRRIQQFFQKHNLNIKKATVDGTLHCKPGAADLLVQDIYSILTNQSVPAVQRQQADFTDQAYQQLLPSLARSTASTAIKNNLTATEIMAEPDMSTNQRKAQIIVRRHLEHRAAERSLLPVKQTEFNKPVEKFT